MFLAVLLPAFAVAQTTTRVDVDSSGVEANAASDASVISSDGRFVAFTSLASNLVANDANGALDVFVRDRATGATECVSVDPSGNPGNDASGVAYVVPSISADGRFVAFVSVATNLVAGLVTTGSQIFVRDRSTGVTELVSVDSSGVESSGGCFATALSGDGGIVAFDSNAANLVAGDTNGTYDVFVHDRATGTTERVSVDSAGKQGNGQSYGPVLSADGFCVAFASSANNLVAHDGNFAFDAFVHDRRTGVTERISVDSSGVEGLLDSSPAALTPDGSIAAFFSAAPNLVPNDTNSAYDIFVRDRAAGVTERVSVDSSGAQADSASFGGSLSADGRFVAFDSSATNLVAGDTNGCMDSFVHDRSTGATSRVSVDSSGAEANAICSGVSITADGGTATFSSSATNLVSGDTNGCDDAFVRDAHVASWSNYGSGFPGTHGIPSFTSSANPDIGTTSTLTLDNSYQQPTFGLVFAGLQRAAIHSSWGGDLLVAPSVVLPITFSFGFDQFDWSIPNDFGLLGITVDLQALEADPGATKGVSFTAGLELVIGL